MVDWRLGLVAQHKQKETRPVPARCVREASGSRPGGGPSNEEEEEAEWVSDASGSTSEDWASKGSSSAEESEEEIEPSGFETG